MAPSFSSHLPVLLNIANGHHHAVHHSANPSELPEKQQIECIANQNLTIVCKLPDWSSVPTSTKPESVVWLLNGKDSNTVWSTIHSVGQFVDGVIHIRIMHAFFVAHNIFIIPANVTFFERAWQ